jgi:hypothetical protein
VFLFLSMTIILEKVWNFLLDYRLSFFTEYCVHVSKTSAFHRKDVIHRDRRDISPAFVFYLGEFEGAKLACYDEDGERILATLGEPYRMGVFDPRLPHEVQRLESFRGSRYCVIFFKMWDSSGVLAPFETSPRYLEENVFTSTIEHTSLPLETSSSVRLDDWFQTLGTPTKVRSVGSLLYFSFGPLSSIGYLLYISNCVLFDSPSICMIFTSVPQEKPSERVGALLGSCLIFSEIKNSY